MNGASIINCNNQILHQGFSFSCFILLSLTVLGFGFHFYRQRARAKYGGGEVKIWDLLLFKTGGKCSENERV